MIIGQILLFALLGGVAGAVHFVAVARDAQLLTHGGSSLAVAGLRLGRLLLTGLMFATAARQGWPLLLAAIGGLMVARQFVLRRLGSVA